MLQAGVAPEEFHESNRRRKAKEMEDLVKFAAAGGFTQDQINGHFISIMRAALPQKYMSDEDRFHGACDEGESPGRSAAVSKIGFR